MISKGDKMSKKSPMMNKSKMQRKDDGLTPAQRKLPPALQAAIIKKNKSK